MNCDPSDAPDFEMDLSPDFFSLLRVPRTCSLIFSFQPERPGFESRVMNRTAFNARAVPRRLPAFRRKMQVHYRN